MTDSTTAGAIFAREQISPNFAQVTWRTFPPNGFDHVGYMKVNGSGIVDVTALTSPTGFGTTPRHDLSPVFNPANGDFYFLSEIKGTQLYTDLYTVHMFNPSTHAHEVIGRVVSSTGEAPLTIQHGSAVVGDYLISPNGRVAAYSSTGGDVFFAVKKPTCCGVLISTFQDCQGGSCYGPVNVYGWFGDRAVLVDGATTYANFYRSKVFASGQHQAVLTGLLPRNPYQLSDAVLSPNGSQMVFEGAQAGATQLFVTPTSTIGHPKTLSTDFLGTIIAWQ